MENLKKQDKARMRKREFHMQAIKRHEATISDDTISQHWLKQEIEERIMQIQLSVSNFETQCMQIESDSEISDDILENMRSQNAQIEALGISLKIKLRIKLDELIEKSMIKKSDESNSSDQASEHAIRKCDTEASSSVTFHHKF